MAPRPEVPRTVKRRRTGYVHHPIIVLDMDRGLALEELTSTDTEVRLRVSDFATAVQRLPAADTSLIVTPDAPRLLAHLNARFGDTPNWQWKITPVRRSVMLPNGELARFQKGETLVNLFGWQHGYSGHAQKPKHRYHYPIDPYFFCRKGINELLPPNSDDDQDRLLRLLQWGQDVREWCESQDLRITPSNGGLAGQLLKDPRWFPEARRKVPRATNDRVRPMLPGNYYRLYGEEGESYQALYLDMMSAHHTIASQISFPDPDSLMAHGYFSVTDVPDVTVPRGRPWLRHGTPAFNRLLTHHGLLYAHISATTQPPTAFIPPWLQRPGSRMAWIFTNELPFLDLAHAHIDWITAAWTSPHTCQGLNQYARYALETLRHASDSRKQWLKPTLLAPYGLLAGRPRRMEYGFHHAKGGQTRQYAVGSTLLTAQAKIGTKERESPITNVLYRGLIEAEQRKRALDLARTLTQEGQRVIAIYADSVFIEQGPPLSLLPPGWRIEAELDSLIFNSSTHFTSRQLTKLPGVRRDTLARIQLEDSIRTRARAPLPDSPPRFRFPLTDAVEVALLAGEVMSRWPKTAGKPANL